VHSVKTRLLLRSKSVLIVISKEKKYKYNNDKKSKLEILYAFSVQIGASFYDSNSIYTETPWDFMECP